MNRVEKSEAGCTIDGYYVGILMYADDILLLSPILGEMQKILNECDIFFNERCLEFNVSKCTCFLIGAHNKYDLDPLRLHGKNIAWVKILNI